MQDENILDIDLDFLANYTGTQSIDVDDTDPKTKIIEDSKKQKPIKDSQEVISDEDSDGIDLEFLASYTLDEEEEVETKKVEVEKSKVVKTDKKTDIVKAILKEFKTEGLVEAEDDEIENANGYDDISKLVARTIKSNELKDLTEDQIDYLKAIRTGIPKEDFVVLKTDIEKVKSINEADIETDTDLASNLIYYDFIEQGLSKDKAAILTDSIMEGSKHIELAKLAKKSLETSLVNKFQNKIKENEDILKANEEKAKSELNTIKEKVTKIDEIIKGVKITPAVKDKVVNSLTKPVSKNKSGNFNNEVMEQYSSNPEYKIALHYLHILTDGFTDFSKLSQKIETKTIKNIDKLLDAERSITGSSANNNESSSKIDYKAFLNNYKIK